MNELEDEPDDVRMASPVEEEVKKAEIDELSIRTMAGAKEEAQPRHRCQKEVSRWFFERSLSYRVLPTALVVRVLRTVMRVKEI